MKNYLKQYKVTNPIRVYRRKHVAIVSPPMLSADGANRMDSRPNWVAADVIMSETWIGAAAMRARSTIRLIISRS